MHVAPYAHLTCVVCLAVPSTVTIPGRLRNHLLTLYVSLSLYFKYLTPVKDTSICVCAIVNCNALIIASYLCLKCAKIFFSACL